jgi:hypothetical protein
MHLENIAQILLPCNICDATFFARFSQCFDAFLMWKQHKPFYQRNLYKRNTNPSILPSLRYNVTMNMKKR